MAFLYRRRSPESMKGFYDWFWRYYDRLEPVIGPNLDQAVKSRIASIENAREMSAIDYACGTGLLTVRIAPLFRSVTGIDQSTGMLSRARSRAERAGITADFRQGNLLHVEQASDSSDWVFVSFALHLFPPRIVSEILGNLLRVARRGVIVVDHRPKWSLLDAIAEWFEGSYYDQFIRIDFSAVATEIGAASFEELVLAKCMVLTFGKC
jgi:ubiquinone/menaquinone biosynthesis C-methylase UbiE